MMKFYYRPGACSMAAHVCLEDLGVPYEGIQVSDEMLYSEEYRKVSPRNQVPVLVTDDGQLTESVAIMTYLANKYGGNLTPAKDSWDYYQMLMKLIFMASQQHPAFAVYVRPFRWTDDEAAQPGVKAAAERNFLACLSRTDGWAEGREWLVGDKMSLADCLAWVHARWGLRVEPKTPEHAPNLWALAKRVDASPLGRKVLELEGLTPLEG